MIIDNHVHITSNGKWFNTTLDASITSLLRNMDDAKVDKSVILPIHGITSNQFVYDTVKQHKDRLIGFGSLSVVNWTKQLEQIEELNLRGVKFHPRIQNQTILDWEREGILDELEKKGLPLLICGWQQTNSKNADMLNLKPLIIDRISKKYEKLKIIIAHLGGHNFFDAFFCARSNPNVFLDCSYFFHFFKGTSLELDALVLMNKIDEKVVFGSDFPEISIKEHLTYIQHKSEFYKFDLSKLCSTNIIKILNHE